MWSNAFSHDVPLRPVPGRAVRAVAVAALLVPALALLAGGRPVGALVLAACAAGVARLSPASPAHLELCSDGGFRLRRLGGSQRATLVGGWLAGRLCGLLLRDDDGRRRAVWLRAGDHPPRAWRRLRVRLRLAAVPADRASDHRVA